MAHDMIFRKLSSDPTWFLHILQAGLNSLSASAYAKYLDVEMRFLKKSLSCRKMPDSNMIQNSLETRCFGMRTHCPTSTEGLPSLE